MNNKNSKIIRGENTNDISTVEGSHLISSEERPALNPEHFPRLSEEDKITSKKEYLHLLLEPQKFIQREKCSQAFTFIQMT